MTWPNDTCPVHWISTRRKLLSTLQALKDIFGGANVSTDASDLQAYGLDWTRFFEPNPLAIVFAENTDQLVALTKLARTEKIGLVPSGGRTGLSAGACATHGEIVVSFDKMNRVVGFNEAEANVTVEPGLVTAALQQFAEEQNLFYPVDFASSGASQIGGNIATNAGGIRVIRYGMTRAQILGLKVVTGSGEILDLNKGLLKNNTGYDLRHLFIGSEGTLGFITEATIQLQEPPLPSKVILLAISSMTDCLSILTTFRSRVALSAFEFFSDLALGHVIDHSELQRPFEIGSPFYVLIECDDTKDESYLSAFEACVANGWVTDGIVASSGQQAQELWQYRERISESITPRTPYKNDIAVTVSQVPAFLNDIDQLVQARYPEFEIVWFGHIGDGNVHLNILKPEDWETDRFKSECETVSEELLGLVEKFGGSISAEHGVGLLKKNHLGFSRTEPEIAALRAIKRVFDPDGVMNPGKLI
ncbi:MAG: FAD-binding oxidoreductase [Pseudomonadales bacterium]|nr:FAD-binding oxidoreductase [Pseudomonadales bacterium]